MDCFAAPAAEVMADVYMLQNVVGVSFMTRPAM